MKKANLFLDQIVLGDALATLKRIPDGCVDVAITSPPYNIGKEYESRRSLEDYIADQAAILREVWRTLKPMGSVFWQVGAYVDRGRHVPLDVKIFPILEDLGMVPRNRIVWLRPHGVHARNRFSCRHETMLWFSKSDAYKFFLEPIRVPQKYANKTYWKGDKRGQLSCDPVGKNPGDVWAFRNVKHNHEEQTVHPCQFPEDLVERVVLATTEQGDLVLDPYVGSGTCAVVAKRLGRHWIGIESMPTYVEVAMARLRGEPDRKGEFPNLRTLREYAEKNGLSDVSKLRFARQVGKMPTTRDKAKIFPEQLHLENFIEENGWEAERSAFRRADALQSGGTAVEAVSATETDAE